MIAPKGDAERCDLLVGNACVLTMNTERTVHDRGAIAIQDGVIRDVGADTALLQRYAAARVIDARGAIVHPGFVDAHYHSTMHTARDAISDLGPAKAGGARAAFVGVFSRWFNALQPEDEHASALLACAEMARNGVTCFMDPGTAFEPDAVARAAEAVGIRASVADPFLWDVEGGLQMASEIERAPADTRRALGLLGGQLWRNRDARSLARGHVAVYGSGSASDELERAASDCASEHRVVLTQHQNLDPSDASFDRARFGQDGIVHFAEIGVLRENCTFMHMNALSDAERDAVVASGMSIVWHPGNFLYYGMPRQGASPVPELHGRGVPIAIGTDLAKAWTFGENGWIGYLVARMNGAFLTAEDILALNTSGGAKAVGLAHEIGSIEPGKRADLVVRGTDVPESWPGMNPVQNVALVSRTKSVETVIVDGRVVVERGRLTAVDEQDVYARAAESAKRIARSIGLSCV